MLQFTSRRTRLQLKAILAEDNCPVPPFMNGDTQLKAIAALPIEDEQDRPIPQSTSRHARLQPKVVLAKDNIDETILYHYSRPVVPDLGRS